MMIASRMPVSPQHSRLDSLTGIRFIAALLVFMFHASLTKIVGFNPYSDPGIIEVFQRSFSVGGWVGVSFFFVLSGFVLTWSAQPTDTTLAFWRRRIVKIYPNHLVTWALAMIVFAGPVTTAAAWVPNLLLIHAWIPNINIFLGVNGPSWSLCCELLFYVSFPFILKRVDTLDDRQLWTWTVATVLLLSACQLAISTFVPGEPHIAEYPISLDQWWWIYFFPPMRLFEFVLGILMARILRAGLWPRIGIVPALLMMVLGYMLATAVPFIYSLNLATLVPIALLITALADNDLRNMKSVFSSRVMVWLGEISFGFYMIHLIIMTCVTRLLGGRHFDAPMATTIVFGTFLLAVIAGWLLFSRIEQPAMRRWGRWPQPKQSLKVRKA